MSSDDVVTRYRRFGPLLFSHFLRSLGDEGRAMKATRYAFEELARRGPSDELATVRWIRNLGTPAQVAQTDSMF